MFMIILSDIMDRKKHFRFTKSSGNLEILTSILAKYDPFHCIVNKDLKKQTLRRIQPILAD